MQHHSLVSLATAIASLTAATSHAADENTAITVARIDTEYQAAVERNDWQAMDRILHPDFTLVIGNGTVYSRRQLIDSARTRTVVFEKQVEIPGTQVVRLFGSHTATVTALLWLKGTRSGDGTAFDYKLWFSDTYVRSDAGWRYAFGQASMPMQ